MSDYKPITGELRSKMRKWGWIGKDDSYAIAQTPPSIDADLLLTICDSTFERLCDAIDAIHAQLEQENEHLRCELDERPIAVGPDALETVARLERENAALKAERDEGLPEQVDAKIRHIPDELRAYANHVEVNGLTEYIDTWPDVAEKLRAFADRIEVSCRTLAANQWIRGLKYAHSDDGLREYGMVSLPVDADGETINANDEMEWLNGTKHGRVTGIGVGEHYGWVWVLEEGKNVSIARTASGLHHYRPDTWESIVYDAMQAGRTDTAVDVTPLIERCKALCKRTKEGAE